jgi:hypothetical protein
MDGWESKKSVQCAKWNTAQIKGKSVPIGTQREKGYWKPEKNEIKSARLCNNLTLTTIKCANVQNKVLNSTYVR